MRGSLKRASNGLNCIGFSLPSVWTKLKVSVTLEKQLENYVVRLFKWVSLNPAKIIGVDQQIGSIEKLKFSDLVIWEPFEVANTSHSHSSNPEKCVYKDMHLMVRVHQVYI
jgi:dihydroorotase-like cyclic amidohydrolase